MEYLLLTFREKYNAQTLQENGEYIILKYEATYY
jgi:hypothetical protein